MKPSEKNPKMNPEFFKNLPSEIIIEILSRLPIRSIAICKCVCKSSQYLLQTREFVDSHLSKSVPGLVTCYEFYEYKVFEFGDELDLKGEYKPVTELDCENSISPSVIKGSVNGLLLLHPDVSKYHDLFISNPINRDYIDIQNKGMHNHHYFDGLVSYGFGVSEVSGEYKVVRIVQKCVRHSSTNEVRRITKSICHVYTLGTRKWRKIEPCGLMGNKDYSIGAFLNGSLHWFVEDFKGSYSILCFDLEEETFSTFSLPSLLTDRETGLQVLVALGDYLCISDSAYQEEVAFWLMKEYGDESSWTKEFVIRKSPDFVCAYGQYAELVIPIKVFENGDVLVTWQDLKMFYYSNETKTTKRMDAFGRFDGLTPMYAMPFTPSFLSLEKSFPAEDVTSFSSFDYPF
ncbi:hypothetical protein ABFS82_03G107900 [Erythranthe guttata]|uniref:F-box domain-containing protein n=1 Tax=Erythranthe guttata TaxID=4155 RepID=A0A022Q6M0_ERYGU|nr:PREDICTED: F-box protein CPR30-like [Erythranthe guttata]EYU22873.1 hypothetical protein MIMGU_mgv1a007630mg [Erythranthe guttata]|eukprot:XP_012854958.1 PREDICTED: F-box protein CPR30-like [Erythranthe guttata]